MDDSQSSDIFSESSLNIQNPTSIDIESYELLFKKIRKSESKNFRLSQHEHYEHFDLILEDCRSCIFQSFDIILSLLEYSAVPVDRICGYIEQTVCVLQILSNFIKKVIESIAITCCNMKTFPINTGNIIALVFTHCKDSECIYGSHLHDVEKHLKDLFRSCHELQLTYLMALGKYCLFDLSEKNEQDILIETLDINLKIGEIVQALDVKTMAEQWKAYIVICEKYSHFLLDKDVYNNCSKLLAVTIENNLKTALEISEDKIIMRSLKVASFTLKILLRMTSIFKGATCNNYEHMLNLLMSIILCNCNYYEMTANKSSEFIKILNAHLSVPVDALVSQLVEEEKFLNVLFCTKIRDCNDPNFLAYILIIVSIMKNDLQKSDSNSLLKSKVIDSIFNFLPNCHFWFNMNLKFKGSNDRQSHGLYEHLLTNILAFSMKMTCNEYSILEKYLYEAILGTDYYCAAFSSNLWVLLCRSGSPSLQVNILQNLLKLYQNLEQHSLFSNSPQQINLSYTIEIFFQTLKYPDKLLIYKQYDIQDSKNIGIWCALKIRNLPENLEISATRFVTENGIGSFDELSHKNDTALHNLIKYMKLSSTCLFVNSNPRFEDLIVKLWRKGCPNCSTVVLQKYMNVHSMSYFRYVESLAYLTYGYRRNFNDDRSLIEILRVISRIIIIGNTDLIILLFKMFCKLILFQSQEMDVLINTLKAPNMENLQNYIFDTIMLNDEINSLITPILNEEPSLKEIRNAYVEYKIKQDNMERNNYSETVAEYKYTHKCLENPSQDTESDKSINKGNFHMDIESFFESDEPASKKPKLFTNIDNLISKLENDAILLSQCKENILSEHKNRIRNVCDKLRNIVS